MNLRELPALVAEAVAMAADSAPRLIPDRNGEGRYLARHYLRGRPAMPDGSDPFTALGEPREGAVWPEGIGVVLHRIYRPDSEPELHCHPWRWSFAVVISGGYVEERRTKDDRVIVRTVLPGRVNVLRARDFHRIACLIGDPCWTLFVTGPREPSWSFWNRDSGEELDWRDFLAIKRGS